MLFSSAEFEVERPVRQINADAVIEQVFGGLAPTDETLPSWLVTIWTKLVDKGTEFLSQGRDLLFAVETKMEKEFGMEPEDVRECLGDNWRHNGIEGWLDGMLENGRL